MVKKKQESVVERIEKINLIDSFKNKYNLYASAVNKDRALPDIRDGLKPSQRRIIYCMYTLGLTPDKPYKKCARIVGEVLGKYHPHGDQSVYDALVNMAQDFNKLYPLIDGHGNFGTVDDGPAAYRYTESRLSPNAMKLLKYLDKNIIDFIPNFDEEEIEPTVLPAIFPNLLVNGTKGIGVGIKSNMPSHNLTEVINGIIAFIDNPKITTKEMLKYIPAPDFPSGEDIYGNFEEIYEKGEGNITLKGLIKKEKDKIVITRIPYQVKKTTLILKINVLFAENKTIKDIRDESDNKVGTRIVLDLKNCTEEEKDEIINIIYNKTSMTIGFACKFKVVYKDSVIENYISLLEMIRLYVEDKTELIERKLNWDLKLLEKRLHLLEGLIKALNDIDNIIKIIRSSKNNAECREKMIKDYTDEQIKYILDLRLSRLTSMEINNVTKEKKDVEKEIKRIQKILKNKKSIQEELKKELNSLLYEKNQKNEDVPIEDKRKCKYHYTK